MDWQEKLKALRGEMPQADEPDVPETAAVADVEFDVVPQKHPRLDISIERKGRGGKTATLVTGWTLPDSQLAIIASRLKQKLGAGGSARGGDILVQGDRRQAVSDLLTQMGFKARII